MTFEVSIEAYRGSAIFTKPTQRGLAETIVPCVYQLGPGFELKCSVELGPLAQETHYQWVHFARSKSSQVSKKRSRVRYQTAPEYGTTQTVIFLVMPMNHPNPAHHPERGQSEQHTDDKEE